MDVFINETRDELCDVLYELHCDIIDVFINETRDELQFPTNVTGEVLYKLHCAIIDKLILL